MRTTHIVLHFQSIEHILCLYQSGPFGVRIVIAPVVFSTLSKDDVVLNPAHHLGRPLPPFEKARDNQLPPEQKHRKPSAAPQSHENKYEKPRDLSDHLPSAPYVHGLSLLGSLFTSARLPVAIATPQINTINTRRLLTFNNFLPCHNSSSMSNKMASEEPPRVHTPPSPTAKRPKGLITPRATPPRPQAG